MNDKTIEPKAVTPKRDRNKITRVKTKRSVSNDSLKQRKIRLTEQENIMLQYILDNKMVGNHKISMRDFFASYIEKEYKKMNKE